jgi:hypothetical protein
MRLSEMKEQLETALHKNRQRQQEIDHEIMELEDEQPKKINTDGK